MILELFYFRLCFKTILNFILKLLYFILFFLYFYDFIIYFTEFLFDFDANFLFENCLSKFTLFLFCKFKSKLFMKKYLHSDNFVLVFIDFTAKTWCYEKINKKENVYRCCYFYVLQFFVMLVFLIFVLYIWDIRFIYKSETWLLIYLFYFRIFLRKCI